jgi:hypothetical protein
MIIWVEEYNDAMPMKNVVYQVLSRGVQDG